MSIFKEKIDALSQGDHRKPHKYIALLSMILILKKQNFSENKIIFDETFRNIFTKIFKKVAKGNDRDRSWAPFFHLRSSGLVNLIPNKGYDLTQLTSVGAPKILNQYVAYATLLPELFSALKNSSIRTEIINEINENLYQYIGSNHKTEIIYKKFPQNTKFNHPFLRYLNTLLRIHGGNENALAEFQAQNPLFAHIEVTHPLEQDIIRDLQEGTHNVILTGHAGDGKTTLAFAVYRKLRGLSPKQPLPELGESRIEFSIGEHKALLIKDLSEQERNEHGKLMQNLLDGETRCLLVSNTGALLEFFLSQEDESRHVELESLLLTSLSKERDESFTFKDRHFKIYNLALRDNLSLAEAVLDKMLAADLWESCDACQHYTSCPVVFNRTLLDGKTCPARQRLFLAYRRLQTYGTRLTMRQLSEHLAYCLTGGLDEHCLCNTTNLSRKYKSYRLYNLFFGGPEARPDALVADMAAIRAIQQQQLGIYPLPCVDKKLWHVLPTDGKTLGIPALVLSIFQSLINQGSSLLAPHSADARLQARRLLYFCADPSARSDISEYQDASLSKRLQKEFLRSPGVLLYDDLYNKNQIELRTKRHLLACLFHVLQEHFTGIHLPIVRQRGRDTLYITLNRPTSLVRQSVQPVLCAVSWQDNFDLRIQERPGGSKYLALEGRRNLRDITPLELTVPFIDYVLRRYEGEMGDLPRATFGQQLDTLKAQIMHCMRDERDDEAPQTMRLLRYCSDYSLVLDEYTLDEDRLEVTRGTN